MRVAFFPDSFHEVNGVAHTSRNFVAYARRHGFPMLCVRAGSRDLPLEQQGPVTTLELKRSRASVGLEKDLSFDPLFARHRAAIASALRDFRPDIIHITGPSELGIFGAWFAWRHGIPLAASWHTNVHEYAARRMQWLSRTLPPAARLVQAGSLTAAMRLYRLAQLVFAPNAELCELLHRRTGRPCFRMERGVDTALFDPSRRTRARDENIVLGYVGRLSVEKNVALLPQIQKALRTRGIAHTRFCIVGHGAEEAALRIALPEADFPGVLRGEALATAYANMDLFVFPSETDTFGNVVLEALSSGVPAAVTRSGGPKFIVRDRETGDGATGIVQDAAMLADAIASLLLDPGRLGQMRVAARAYALQCSWDAVFDRVYNAYRDVLTTTQTTAATSQSRHHE